MRVLLIFLMVPVPFHVCLAFVFLVKIYDISAQPKSVIHWPFKHLRLAAAGRTFRDMIDNVKSFIYTKAINQQHQKHYSPS